MRKFVHIEKQIFIDGLPYVVSINSPSNQVKQSAVVAGTITLYKSINCKVFFFVNEVKLEKVLQNNIYYGELCAHYYSNGDWTSLVKTFVDDITEEVRIRIKKEVNEKIRLKEFQEWDGIIENKPPAPKITKKEILAIQNNRQ